MHKLDKTILHGGLCHAGYSRLRTSTASRDAGEPD